MSEANCIVFAKLSENRNPIQIRSTTMHNRPTTWGVTTDGLAGTFR